MGLNFGGALFPSRGELIETFDFSDIATGLGFEIFYGSPIVDTSGTSYTLLPFAVHSGDELTQTTQIGTGTTTVNFDSSTFNLPRTAKGTAYPSFGLSGTVNNTTSAKVQIAIIHADLSVTNISSEFETVQTPVAITTELLALPLTQTTIKKGEKLRMIVKIVVDGGGGNGTLYHDSLNSDDQFHLKLLMPFRIES